MFHFDNVSTVLLCLFDRKVTSKYGGKLPFEKKASAQKRKKETKKFMRIHEIFYGSRYPINNPTPARSTDTFLGRNLRFFSLSKGETHKTVHEREKLETTMAAIGSRSNLK